MADSPDYPAWFYEPPLAPTEFLRVGDGVGPSDILGAKVVYDVDEHYERVKSLHDAYPLRERPACDEFMVTLFRRAFNGATRVPSAAVGAELLGVFFQALVDERIFYPS